MLLRRLCVTLVLGILMAVAFVQGAAADPINAKNATTFTASCNGQGVELVVNGAGNFTPAHVVGGTAVCGRSGGGAGRELGDCRG